MSQDECQNLVMSANRVIVSAGESSGERMPRTNRNR